MGLWEILTNNRRNLTQAVRPRRTFDDVILPESTLRALEHAFAQIVNHDLIFNRWGLGQRHAEGLGLAFVFAGPPGTGKTICAEALANSLGKSLLVVRYSELESMWVGETGKNVSALFRTAAEQDAVLFFDEADAIASRRFISMNFGYEREANAVVNVLLSELEHFSGVTIFATNLAANFDPAFERRIRTHILFQKPGPKEREHIWKVQLHPERTPLGADVDFRALAQKYELSGGDIKNAVLKAAQMASIEPIEDAFKRINQCHFERGVEEVLTGRDVMSQSLYGDDGPDLAALFGQRHSAEQQRELSGRVGKLQEEFEAAEQSRKEEVEALRAAVQQANWLALLLGGGSLLGCLALLTAWLVR